MDLFLAGVVAVLCVVIYRLHREVYDLWEKMDDLRQSVHDELCDVSREVGRLDGILEADDDLEGEGWKYGADDYGEDD